MLSHNDSFLSGMSSSKKNDNSTRFHTKDKKLISNEQEGRLSRHFRSVTLFRETVKVGRAWWKDMNMSAYIFPIVAVIDIKSLINNKAT
jgi:hypothetical protein